MTNILHEIGRKYGTDKSTHVHQGISYLHIYDRFGNHIADEETNTIDHIFDYEFDVDAGNFTDIGIRSFVIQCNNTNQGGHYQSYFEVTKNGMVTNEDITPIIAIILLPMLLSFIFLIGAATLNPERHSVMKIGLFLLSIVPFFVSSYFAGLVIVEYYGSTAM